MTVVVLSMPLGLGHRDIVLPISSGYACGLFVTLMYTPTLSAGKCYLQQHRCSAPRNI